MHTADTALADLPRSRFWAWLLVIVALAAALRLLFPVADPPWQTRVGVVWHDEGAWAHNARNRVLFGDWVQDRWNPMYITPVLTGLEFVSFSLFGVGLWQARLVSEIMGIAAVLLLGLSLRRIAGPWAGLFGAALLATAFFTVMYDRAALMEATMVAFMVAAFAASARADDRPAWALLVGPAALLAYFTKAAAVFLVGAIVLDSALTLWLTARGATVDETARRRRRAAVFTLGGLAVAGLVALAVFVLPNWVDYRFYNWQMSVTRKPSYTLRALVDRASWLPVVHDFFTRQWAVTLLALAGAFGCLARWRQARPSERLLGWWLALGIAELVLHDVGNERRLVFLAPALTGLAAIVLGGSRQLLPHAVASLPRRAVLAVSPMVLYGIYVAVGALGRLPFIYEIGPGVRWSAAVAAVLGAAVFATWPAVPRWLASARWSTAGAALVVALVAAGNMAQYAQWAAGRTAKNYAAMKTLGRLLPPGTLVHGKLANGLSLENRIRPVFVGNGFGNYEDRLDRDDIRYLVTYVTPRLGYEGPVIRDVLDAYPDWHILARFDVAESGAGHDQAALIDKGRRAPLR